MKINWFFKGVMKINVYKFCWVLFKLKFCYRDLFVVSSWRLWKMK